MASDQETEHVAAETASGDETVILHGPSAPKERRRRRQLGLIFPVILGLFVLVINIILMNGSPLQYALSSMNGPVGSVSSLLVIISTFIGGLLIIYAIVVGFTERSMSLSDGRRWFRRWIVVPLVLGLLAPLFTVWSLCYWNGAYEQRPQQSCLELYERAQNIRKDNPGFRMPSGDQQEVRCNINHTVLGI
ncbi:hypothetical protein [Mycolicibacterium aromaticivorans]|uniref:hypothetical protein n=1 Tax=Mycolicibacterium aromaticivorans TaxID=318425 RepID=UPI00103B3AAF|nr:hypothetical protein [Mycolicibacterium aromaticivorans]